MTTATAINVSPEADKEIKRLLSQDQNKHFTGIRVGVKGGGCSGLTYTMNLDEAPQEKDRVFDCDGYKIFCDAKSFLYLNGLTLEYSSALIDGGFRFNNPNATRTCSCGTSFSA